MKRVSIIVTVSAMFGIFGCDQLTQSGTPKSASAVRKATVNIETDPTTGLTAEQKNIKERLVLDNKPGAIKHLYVISPYSGQIILYSTVRTKPTSSGKRLSPTTVATGFVNGESFGITKYGMPVNIGGEIHYTSEVLQDDGSYGSSEPYIYWWDVQGVYHQHFFTGGQIIHVSDQPIPMKNVVINMEEISVSKQGE